MTTTLQALTPVLSSALTQLQGFANLHDADILLQEVFGNDNDVSFLLNSWRSGNFSSLPTIEIIDTAKINGALGAFARANGTIYLSNELLQIASPRLITEVFLEEYGHYLDSLLNVEDTPGDEGEHFVAVVTGRELTPEDLARIKSENDKAIVTINGETLEIEQFSVSIRQITDNFVDDFNVRASGNNIVWQNSNGVYLYNGFSTTLLSPIGRDPEISGSNVVWKENGGLFLFNGFNIVRIPNTGGSSNNHRISGNNVVWREGSSNPSFYRDSRVFFYDGSAARDITINGTTHSGAPNSGPPNISGKNVVWTAQPSSTNFFPGIYQYNGSFSQQITNNRIRESFPAVSGNNIVWLEGSSIIFYNGFNTKTIASGVSNVSNLQIDDNNVVWQEGNDNLVGTSVFFYDGFNVTRLTQNNRSDQRPSLSGNQVVWEGWDGNDREIFYYDGKRISQITNNNVNDLNPVISGDNIAWRGYDGADFEIFQAKLPPTIFAVAHNTFSNTNDGWLVKGGTLENSFSLPSWAGWKPVATGDFTFDGQTDIIVTQPSTGFNALWVTNQGQVSWVAGLPSWGTEWEIVDTGDFNNNGNTDILVTNSSNGWNAIWDMYGTTFGGFQSASFWPRWQAVAAGDMNNDGNMDVLIRNMDFGWNAVHLMDGNGQLLSTEGLPNWSPDWRITGTADINGDGKTDILASYPSQGWNVAWIMDGTQFSYQQGFPGGFGTEVIL